MMIDIRDVAHDFSEILKREAEETIHVLETSVYGSPEVRLRKIKTIRDTLVEVDLVVTKMGLAGDERMVKQVTAATKLTLLAWRSIKRAFGSNISVV